MSNGELKNENTKGMPVWMGKSHEVPPLDEELSALTAERRICSPQQWVPQFVPSTNWSAQTVFLTKFSNKLVYLHYL